MFAYNVPNWKGRPLASITREDAKTAVYDIADRGKLTMSRRFQTFLDLFSAGPSASARPRRTRSKTCPPAARTLCATAS